MRIIDATDIDRLDRHRLIDALAEGFRAHGAGQVQLAAVGHLAFEHGADCHIKSAWIERDSVFAVKLVNSFHHNPAGGPPPEDGFNVICSAETGEVLAILHDRGMLSKLRTALTGALVARLIARPGPVTLGIIGSGEQARLQAQAIREVLPVERILVSARNPERAAALARTLGGEVADVDGLCAQAGLIVLATAATSPLIHASQVRRGTRIVAVGADAPGKQELDPAILTDAFVIADSRAQCIDHGECGWAVHAGLLEPAAIAELGTVIDRDDIRLRDQTVVADLTGIGVQDLVIAKEAWRVFDGGS